MTTAFSKGFRTTRCPLHTHTAVSDACMLFCVTLSILATSWWWW